MKDNNRRRRSNCGSCSLAFKCCRNLYLNRHRSARFVARRGRGRKLGNRFDVLGGWMRCLAREFGLC